VKQGHKDEVAYIHFCSLMLTLFRIRVAVEVVGLRSLLVGDRQELDL